MTIASAKISQTNKKEESVNAKTTLGPLDNQSEVDALLARARALQPMIREHAAQSEKERKVVEPVIAAMEEAGLFKVAVPKRYGGLETSTRTMLDLSATIAEADGGTSWVVNLTAGCAWLASLFPERAQNAIWGANPNARVSGVLTPSAQVRRVEGGYKVDGKWYYNSASWHADWAVVGMPIVDEAGQTVDQGLALIPVNRDMIEDTWFVAGMAASGSNCIVGTDLFVPDHCVLSVTGALDENYGNEHLALEPFYRCAFVPLLSLILIGPQLGLARAAFNFVKERAAKRAIAYTSYTSQANSVAFQLQLAEAALLIETAHLHAYRAADDVDRAGVAGERLDFVTRARIRAEVGLIAEKVTRAIEILLYAHGAGGFATSSPLQRIWRDSAVAARHAIVLPAIGYEMYGKALLGVEERISPLI